MSPFARVRYASFFALTIVVGTTTACTAGSTSTGSDLPGEQGTPHATPVPTGSATTTTPPAHTPDAGADATPAIDHTVHFALTIDGQAIVPKVTVQLDPATNLGPAAIVVKASHPQQLNGGTSTATFTLTLVVDEKGEGSCGSARSAGYFFKDTDGARRGIGTSYQGGACTMNVITNEADGFTSGTASGTLGGATSKSFTVSWGQNLTK